MSTEPLTLRSAQEQLHREWPGRHATNAAWLAYHQRAAALYRRVAETDQAHHYEALHFAQYERAEAELLAGQGTTSESSGAADPT
jgi:hypothetical protein